MSNQKSQKLYSVLKSEKNNTERKFTTVDICIVGLFIAAEIIMKTYFQISVWNLKIGLGFFPVALVARRYGAALAVPTAMIGDVVGWALVPTGPYYPAFTISAALTALITSIFIHRKCSILRIISYVLINNILFTLFLNSFWIHILYGAPYWPLFLTRLSSEVPAMLVIEIVVMSSVFAKADRILTKNFHKNDI